MHKNEQARAREGLFFLAPIYFLAPTTQASNERLIAQ